MNIFHIIWNLVNSSLQRLERLPESAYMRYIQNNMLKNLIATKNAFEINFPNDNQCHFVKPLGKL